MGIAEYIGVTGGGYDGGIATTTFPVVAINAFFPIANAGAAAFIITQKGSHKYLVAAQATRAVTAIIPGNAYVINTLGNTYWPGLGATVNAQPGDVFTATKAGTGTGLVSEVVTAFLTNVATGSLVAGQMNMIFTVNSVALFANKLTNKYIWDTAVLPNGSKVPGNKFAVNFFVGSASTVTTAKSGADKVTFANGTGAITLGVVNNFTS